MIEKIKILMVKLVMVNIFTISGTQILAHGSLILLQLPLLLTLTISGLALHGWLLIEIQLNEFMRVKFYRIVNPVKNTLSTNLSIFIYTISFFSSNTYECR